MRVYLAQTFKFCKILAKSFLFFMPISQESLVMISMPNSAITVSQMHIPSKTHFQKAVGGVKKNSVVNRLE